jgi:uncharacterized protein (TIGR03437 family)
VISTSSITTTGESGKSSVRRQPQSRPFSAARVVKAASGIAGPVAPPAKLISVYGTNLDPTSVWVNAPENNGYLTVAGYSHILPGPGGPYANSAYLAILSASANQINPFIPYSISSASTIPMQVEVDGVSSATVTLTVATSAFGLFTDNGSGSGQGATLNQDDSYNSAANRAGRGSIVSLYGTGDRSKLLP